MPCLRLLPHCLLVVVSPVGKSSCERLPTKRFGLVMDVVCFIKVIDEDGGGMGKGNLFHLGWGWAVAAWRAAAGGWVGSPMTKLVNVT